MPVATTSLTDVFSQPVTRSPELRNEARAWEEDNDAARQSVLRRAVRGCFDLTPATAQLSSLFGRDGSLGLASTRASPLDKTCSAFLNQSVSPPATLRGQVR
jgi:hypothetical protein